MNMKTIFIPFTRALLVRNILRNQFFKKLKEQKDVRIILLFSLLENRKEVDYLKKEFSSDNVIVEFVPNNRENKIKRLFTLLSRNLVFSPTTKLYARFGTAKVQKKSSIMNVVLHAFYTPLSKIQFLKRMVWWIETYCFRDIDYIQYFEKYKPDLVFSTAILSNFDLAFLKIAKKRGIKTIAMPKSWDNLDKILFRFEPDVFAVQNEWMRFDAVRYQGYNKKKIEVVGFLQFDIYRDNNAIESRESYCVRKGFNPNLPILFIGSEGLWSKGDGEIFKQIIEARDKGIIPACNILIRPHFSLPYTGEYDHVKNYKHVFIDYTYRVTEFFADHWDPTEDDMKDFTNTLRHCDISLNFASTLTLDAMCFDKPVINIAFGLRFENSKDITPIIYETGFYREVINTNATEMVYSYHELFKAINNFLKDPSWHSEGRDVLRNKLCYKVDGQSGNRLFSLIQKYL